MTVTPRMRTVGVSEAVRAARGGAIAVEVDDPRDVAGALLSALPDDKWDLPMAVYGLLSAARARDEGILPARADGEPDITWLAVPVDIGPLPDPAHFAHALVGLSLPGWDGALFYSEVWTTPADGVGEGSEARVAAFTLAGEDRSCAAALLMRGAAAPELRPWPGWVGELLATALHGSGGARVPVRAAATSLAEGLLCSRPEAAWLVDDSSDDAAAVAAGAEWLTDPDEVCFSLQHMTGETLPTTWDELIGTLRDGPSDGPLALTDASADWFGGIAPAWAFSRNVEGGDLRSRVVFDVGLASQLAFPAVQGAEFFDVGATAAPGFVALPEADAVAQAAAVLPRLSADLPAGMDLDLVAAATVGQPLCPESPEQIQAWLSSPAGRDFARNPVLVTVRHPEARVRAASLYRVVANSRSPDISAALGHAGAVPAPLARKLATRMSALAAAVGNLATGPPEDMPTPMRRAAEAMARVTL